MLKCNNLNLAYSFQPVYTDIFVCIGKLNCMLTYQVIQIIVNTQIKLYVQTINNSMPFFPYLISYFSMVKLHWNLSTGTNTWCAAWLTTMKLTILVHATKCLIYRLIANFILIIPELTSQLFQLQLKHNFTTCCSA